MGKYTEKEPESNITQDELINDIQNEVKTVSETVSLSPKYPEVKTRFFKVETYKDGKFKGIEIEHKGYLDAISELGYFKYNIGEGYIFIHVKNNILEVVSTQRISDTFRDYLLSIPSLFSYDGHSMESKYLVEKFYRNINLFAKPKLELLPTIDFESNKDKSKLSYFYFRNGFVECSAEGYKFKDYSNLKGYIWKKQIIDFEFKYIENTTISENSVNQSMFSEFVYLISNKDFNRYKSLLSLMGYLLHDFFQTERRAVVLTDSKISDANEGRTGKGIFAAALLRVRSGVDISGKHFKQNDQFKYQAVTMDHQIVHLDDPTPYFNIQNMYTDILTGIKVEKKNQPAFSVDAKIIISCNKTLKTDGGSSSRGRMYEFELADFFNDAFTPKHYFKKRLFDDWDSGEWQEFYNFIMAGMCFYLSNGIIQAKPINLIKRKLIDSTKIEFYKWVEEMKFTENVPYVKSDLSDLFFSEYPELAEPSDRASAVKFGKWFKIFIDLYGFKSEISKSNSVQKITLVKKNENSDNVDTLDFDNDIF